MKIGFLFGTETGNSEMLCEDMIEELGEGVDTTLTNLADIGPDELDKGTFYIIATSTYGNGDLPTQALAFEDAITTDKPDLTGIRFAMFGLGDQVFAETYNNGSKRLADLLVAAGAEMVGTRGLHDASSLEMPEDLGLPWLRGIMELEAARSA